MVFRVGAKFIFARLWVEASSTPTRMLDYEGREFCSLSYKGRAREGLVIA